ncbi:phosphoglucomutase-2 [Chrysoperla carnea]|uniref:phosphoglucomutase-2 n=1 Tax=Chrysoperla carnea TaxID=189513 RepID=UPI001D0762C3|nr:phosphoglucomutase-2 [Chrysoperla carnea]
MSNIEINSSNPLLDEKISEWLKWDRNIITKLEIEKLVNEKNFNELSKILLNRISFGTAGLRGKMAAGYANMNDLVIIQTGQGLLKYLQNKHNQLLTDNGIVIGYDGRHNSKRFAELTAAIFLNEGVTVHLFSTVVPTPFVPFATTKWKCAAGIMVTASHNPKEDNGYKLYGWNGSQIISPADKEVTKCILKNLTPLETSWDIAIVHRCDFLRDPLPQTLVNYYLKLGKDLLNEHKAINGVSDLKFTYTAMHGVGYNYVVRGFKLAGLQLIPVIEQQDPDPEFPTVKFPNPEEGQSALDLSFKTADANDSTIILANDPDADRLACAEKLSNGQWRVFNGNEIGALLGWWALHCFQMKNPSSNLSDVYVLSSTVSSKILRSIAVAEGLNFVETLTGFKWMGNKTHELENNGKQVIFAFEEAIGFMFGTAVKDKDGVSAAVHLATLAAFLHKHGLTLVQQLDEIYKEYGYHISENSYFICHDGAVIEKIFNRLRNFNGDGSYPESIKNGKYKIKNVRDLTTGYDNSQNDFKAILPVSKSSQMITFTFSNGLVATLRTSGTEPKVKYYTELCTGPTQVDRKELEETLRDMVSAIVDEFLEPTKNGLEPRSD